MTRPPDPSAAKHAAVAPAPSAPPQPTARIAPPRERELVLPVIAGCVTLLSSVTLSVVSAWLILRAWQMPPVLELGVAITAVRALGISRAVFRYMDRLASHNVALRSAARMRAGVYAALAGAPTQRVLSLPRATLLSHIGADVDALTDAVVRTRIPRRVALAMSVASVGFVALLSLPAAGLLAAGLLVAGVGAAAVAGRAEALAPDAAALEAHGGAVDHVLRNSAALRVRGQLEGALQRAGEADARVAAARARAFPWAAWSAALWVLASAGTAVAVVGVAAVAAPQHSVEWLGVVALLPLAAFEAVSLLPDASRAAKRADHAAARLGGLASESGVGEAAGGVTGASWPVGARGGAGAGSAGAEVPALGGRPVYAKDLVVGRQADRPLQRVSLEVPAGGRHVIVADSGSGKTTLLMTLAGLLPPLGGEYRAEGALFVAEDEHVFATTVRDNLAVSAAAASDAAMLEVLDAVGLREWVEQLPQGLGTVLEGGAGSLSGGQRRRLIVARALLSAAPILLLDEPTEHLDPQGEREMLRLLGCAGAGDAGLKDAGTHLSSSAELPWWLRRTIIVVRHPRP